MKSEAEPCYLCHGRREMTFAKAAPLRFSLGEPQQAEAVFQRETYPCPACSTPQNKVAIAVGRTRISNGLVKRFGSDEQAKTQAAHQCAQELMRFLVDEGILTPQVEQRTDSGDWFVKVELGVVTDRFQELRDSFVKNEVAEAVNRVADEAIKQIANWGSASRYTDWRIEKDVAHDFIRAAVKRELER